MVPTPVTAYGSRERGCRIGFSVTASHNPPEYSGVKFFNGKGMELSTEEERRIERVLSVDVKKSAASYGSIRQWNPLDQYVQAIIGCFGRSDNALKVVVDCVNGPGALVTPKVLQALGHRVVPLNAQVSWRFPARMPEPTPQTLTDTAAVVSALGASFGFAHDGDADRLVMINSAGQVLPDSVVSILALRALAKRSGVVVLSENTSFAVEEEATNLGHRVVRSRIGKTFAEIEKESAIFASEPSKVVNPEWGMWEDGMYCAALITDAISRNPELLNLLNSEAKWHYRQVNVQVSVDFQVMSARAESEFARFRISEVRLLDGLKLIFKDQSWVMFRPSGTEPKVRVYCESRDQLRLVELLDVANRVLQESVMMSSGGARRGQPSV
jgi:phosphomannomutase